MEILRLHEQLRRKADFTVVVLAHEADLVERAARVMVVRGEEILRDCTVERRRDTALELVSLAAGGAEEVVWN